MENNDYILRSDALEIAMEWCPDDDGSVGKVGDLREMLDELESIPAADVEPKRSTGWWIPGDYVAVEHGECVTYPGEGITCSWCHYGFKGRFLWSREYCPHCGSRMLPEPPKEGDDEQTG